MGRGRNGNRSAHEMLQIFLKKLVVIVEIDGLNVLPVGFPFYLCRPKFRILQWNGLINHRTGKERINMALWSAWRRLTDAGFWLRAESGAAKNWLFLTNIKGKDNFPTMITIQEMLLRLRRHFLCKKVKSSGFLVRWEDDLSTNFEPSTLNLNLKKKCLGINP